MKDGFRTSSMISLFQNLSSLGVIKSIIPVAVGIILHNHLLPVDAQSDIWNFLTYGQSAIYKKQRITDEIDPISKSYFSLIPYFVRYRKVVSINVHALNLLFSWVQNKKHLVAIWKWVSLLLKNQEWVKSDT